MNRKKFLTAFLIATTVLNTGLIMPSNASERQERTITVTGEGVENIPTTLARVQLGVEIQGADAATVQREIATRSDALVKFLRSRQVEKLETTGINLQPNYNYNNNQRQLVGYVGTNIVSFQMETEKVGNLLDEAVKAGATRIDNIGFTAKDEAIATARQSALVKATQQARQQAAVVLQSLGFTPKEPVSIQIGNTNNPVPIAKSETVFRSADAAPPSPVIGGEQTVRAFVTLEISY
ncbi:SIMPL domain-containing protein [Pannus brasiliensis CCIBt3594]|uniref:SIMPL domain-containing protein n=1 Tax=Pannus brasiliensis CCIBt3594 TaxID=1427578 RepID=A0AAW9QPY3_9CHRO